MAHLFHQVPQLFSTAAMRSFDLTWISPSTNPVVRYSLMIKLLRRMFGEGNAVSAPCTVRLPHLFDDGDRSRFSWRIVA